MQLCFLTGVMQAMGSNDVLLSRRSLKLVKLKIGESEEIMNMMDSNAALFVPETLEIRNVLNKLLGCDKRQFKHFKLN